jgi:hypothetical protein
MPLDFLISPSLPLKARKLGGEVIERVGVACFVVNAIIVSSTNPFAAAQLV